MKRGMVFILSLAVTFLFFACGSTPQEEVSEVAENVPETSTTADVTATTPESGASDSASLGTGVDWPTGPAAQGIPVCENGTVLHVTEHNNSDYIMIGDVSKEEAKDYWDKAQQAGFTNITSKSESPYYDGFTYVADNGQGVSLSVTWAPGSPSTMTILSILI